MLVYNENTYGFDPITMEGLKELANNQKHIDLAEIDYETYEKIQQMFTELNVKVFYNTPALMCGKLLGLTVVH